MALKGDNFHESSEQKHKRCNAKDEKIIPCRREQLRRKRLYTAVYHVIKWSDASHAGVVFTIVSFVFISFYLLNATFVTAVSLSFSAWILFDLIHPLVSGSKCEQWNEEDQKSFDDACSNLLQIQLLVEENCRNIREMYRQERNTFLLRLLMGFLLLAWLGTFVPGILVAYFVVLMVVALPGLVHRNLLSKSLLQDEEQRRDE